MGRFATTVEFYARYREPYPPRFFQQVAEQLALRGDERLLDVGCGPGLLAMGFAPYVGHSTGLDPEEAMLEAARARAVEFGKKVAFVHGRIEEFEADEKFEVVTIGRALHWLDREATWKALDRLLTASGKVVTCGATTLESEISPWRNPYEELRDTWSADWHAEWYRIDPGTWFVGSPFEHVADIAVTEQRKVTVPELIGRALSKSNTCPEVLGDRRGEFEAAIAAMLEPFAKDGALQEEIVARATVLSKARQ